MAHVGSQITFSVTFTNSAGADADPTVVTFWLREEVDGTELQWTYNAAAVEGTHFPTGMNAIVKDSTGDYSLVFIARKPERHSGVWVGSGTIFQTSTSTVLVRHSPIAAIDSP